MFLSWKGKKLIYNYDEVLQITNQSLRENDKMKEYTTTIRKKTMIVILYL